MTQYIRARFSIATRFGVGILTVVILALMNGDRPAGQIATFVNAIDFLGTTAANQYITFGPATGPNGLNATDFTLELWFKKEGAGVTTTTSAAGGGGLSGGAVPLVAKGRGEGDGSNIDMNYFLGLSLSAGVYTLAADFEDTAAGINHAVTSTQAISDNTWYHAAATYTSSTGIFTLYLNGVALPGNITVPALPTGTRIPRSDNIQHASIGSALTSAGTAGGFFNGVIDEVRIWNVARTAQEISDNRYKEVTAGTGLIGRWGLNEGAGSVALNSVPGRPHGTLVSGPGRVVGNILPVDGVSPSVPQNVAANIGNGLVTLTWPENPELDLAGYNVYRNGSGTPLNVAPLTSAIFTDNTVANGTLYSYTVRALDTSANLSSPSTAVVATPNALAGAAMQFNGINQYVTFGPADGTSALGASTFTIETWFKRTGFGVGTSTGAGGFENATTGLAIPLISKGRAQADGSNLDTNYILGINDTTGVLIADFEDTGTGLNHPVSGITPIPISTTAWHHAAVTYDGTTWNLYLDGALEKTTTLGTFTPRFDSIQHAGIGTAMTSTGAAAGFFNGLMDEVRIWNVARSQVQIQNSMFQEVDPTTQPTLIGRWALNEASGLVATGSARAINGTLVGTPTWTAGYPYPIYVAPPAAPQNLFADPLNARVSLTWTANAESDLAGYNVYRSLTSPVSTAIAPLNGSTLVTSPNYLDLGAANGTQYFYVVTAVDGFGNTSAPSNEDDATPLASLNQTPIVTAGPDRVIDFGGTATLSGAATDDGPFGVLWTLVSGPGVVNFASATSAATTATFTEAGTYVLRLTADDGAKSAFDDMTVTVNLILLGAGDVAPNCIAGDSLANANATATLLEGLPGPVFTLGDNSYVNGTAAEFDTCYTPTWGRPGIKARTRPVTGNHDYNTPGATGYYDYFNGDGVQDGPAGDRTLGGYYSYNVGNWHIVVLNGECSASPELWDADGCAAGSPQEQWLRDDLANSPTNNIIAMWHRPRYSSSSDDDMHAYTQPLWQALYDYGTDIYLGGHWHNYERLAPMNALGVADPAFGIRTFVIGTGGVPVSGSFPNLRTGISEVRNNTDHGIMKFTLRDSSYDWQFIPVPGDALNDSGTAAVHGAPGSQPPVVNAGADQIVDAGAAELNGSVTDDSPNTITWSQVSGPAAAAFGNANSAVTSVGFTTAGTYVLQLTVDDNKYVRSDTVSITVTAATGNLPPMVNVGADQFVTLPNHASLTATLNDDGFTGIDVSPTWTNQTPAVGTVTFDDPNTTTTTASFSGPGTYVLRLTATDGEINGFDELTVTVNPTEPNNAIDFTGTNGYVSFGAAPGLGVSTMTIEAWFKRDGEGAPADTGTGGFLAIPIVAKGRAQDEATTNNMNFFLGIKDVPTGDVLAADFEDNNTGLNHPIAGVTTIPADGTWHHAAATYGDGTWRLYLDGTLEATSAVGAFTPRFDSIQHASIGSALNTSGTPEGFFNGVIDEVRIWDRALTVSELQAGINQQILNVPNLVARWGLNESGSTTTVLDSTPIPVNGTINGSGWARTAGAPFNLVFNQAPNLPVLNTPENGATDQTNAPNLSVNVSDPESQPLNVTFFGRATNAAAAGDFTIVAIPDTQHYVDDTNPSDADGDRALTFTQQTQWIVSSRPTLNTVFVSHLGDIAEHIDAQPAEWTKADASMDVLDLASPPVPYGIAPGNHDMSSAGVSTNYDLYFPVSRMSGYPWYGGYLGQNQFSFTDPINRLNKNQYSLFSVGGMDFVVIHLEYDMPTYSVAWADRVLKAFPNRKAIIATHLFLSDSGSRPTTVLNRTTDGTPAATVWTNLIVPNCNVFLILNGHYPGEANRSDATPTNAACPSRTVHQLESDYQSRVNGGDGWLRYMTFKPSENKIYVYTYSPKLLQFETDANSQFVLDFNMQGVPFTQIGTDNSVPSGTPAETTWAGRTPNTQYQWYATVSDGNQTVTGPTWSFTTDAISTPASITTQPQSQTIASGATANLSVGATGTAPLTYQWYQGTAPDTTTLVGTNSANFTTPNLTTQTSYWVRVSNAFGPSVDSATATISIGVAPAIGTQPQSQTIASGATANLSVSATGTNLSYQWYRGTAPDTSNQVGTNSANFTTPNLATQTSYWVRVSNAFGPSVDSATATISIGVAAAIGTQPQSQTIASGATANLSVSATGTNLSYQWYRGTAPDTTNLVGSNSPNFTTPNLTTQTSYWVRASNAFGPSVNSATATISIGVGAAIDTQPQSQTIASGATANLSVGATGENLSYQWYQGPSGTTTTAVGTNSPNFTTPNLTVATSYWVRVSNSYGTVDSSAAVISIGVAAAIGTQPQSQTIASNTTANLSVGATGGNLIYQWYQGTAPDTTTAVGSNSPNFTTPNLTTETSYWVRVSNAFGPSLDSATATISIGVAAAIGTQPQSQTITTNTTANLSVGATGTNLTYQWYRGTAPDTTNLVGSNSPNFTTPNLTTQTSYWVRVSNAFGPSVNSATATISIGIAAAIGTQPQSQTIASGATANLSIGATGTNLSYQWYQGTAPDTSNAVGSNSSSFTTPNLTTQTSYWVRVSNAFGPSVNSATATISIGVAAAIGTQPQSQTIASNTTANLSVGATGTNLSYQWYRGTAPDTTSLVGSNSPNFTTPNLTTQTSYWVRVSNAFGPSVNSATATISIGVGAAISTHPQSQTIASGTTADLSVGATGENLSYQWYQGPSGTTTTAVGTNSANFTTPNLTTQTSYWVRVSNAFGAVNSSAATISIGVAAAIGTPPQNQTIASNATANLSVGATGTSLTYQWYQGTAPDTSNSVGTNSANFTTPNLTTQTSYWVRVSNAFGPSVDSATATISIGVAAAVGTPPQSQTITSGTSANLSVGATGTNLTYQWYRGTAPDTTNLVGSNSPNFTTPNLTTQTSYWVRVSNAFGPSVNSATATISIGVAAAIGTQPQSQTIASNTTANLSVGATGTNLTYQWYQGTSGTTTTPVGSNSANFTTPNLTTQTSYWVRVSNAFGPGVNSATATISIGVGPAIATQPQNQTIVSGATANLSVGATGTNLSYQWYQGPSGTTTTPVGANSANFTTPALTTQTSYWVRVSNAFGPSVDSSAATISITVAPPVTFTPLGVGTHFPTVDNADGPGPGPRAITPPAVQLGDMVVIVAAYGGTATLTMSETGGQAWTAEANTQANGQTVRVFWSQFNGTWTANPAVTNTTGTGPLTVYSFAVDLAPGTYPEIDVPFVSGNHSGGTVTVPSFSTSTPGALALVGWISADNNTWAAPTTGWSMPGGQAQWRNNSSADNTIALAYRNIASAGATGSIARTQTNGPDTGLYFRMAFKATQLTPATPPSDPANLLASASIGQVELTWTDTSTNEFAFQIERCTNPGCTNFAPLTGVGSNVTSYRDTTVAGTTTYRYRVRANNVFGPSEYSTSTDVTTPTPAFAFRGVGTHFPTVENADQGAGPGPRAIVPPASLQLGDLVVIVAAYQGTATLTLTETGGQIWTSETNTQANGQTVRVFWSQFNGVWTANPAVSNTTGTSPLTVYSMAFDMAPGLYPEIDVPFGSGSHSGGTVTVPSFTTNTTGVLALAGWISGDNNSWSAPTAGWSTPGGQAQWRNSNGSDSSVAFAYRLLGPAGPSGTIVRTQSASGPDTGIYFRLGFRALEVPSNPPGDPSDLQATPSVGQVALTWIDNANNEAGFNIERCAGIGCTNFLPLTVVGPNTASYNDNAVAGTTTYRYQVRAYNLFSPSNYSNIADALTPALPPPPPIPFTFRSVGSHYPTVDNTNGTGPGPRAVTPPATLQAGDLYVIVAAYRGNVTLSMAGTGGQTWNAESISQANGVTARVFWTRFNGTWAGTPSVTNTTGTEALSVYNFAFAMSAGMHPEIDVPVFSAGHSGGAVTVPSFATNTAGTLALAGWLSNENNSWSAPTTGWSVPGGQQQWRNTTGEDTSLAFAYRVFTAAGPTGSVVRSEGSGDDPGLYFRLAWKQVPD